MQVAVTDAPAARRMALRGSAALSLIGLVAVVSAVLAGSVIWLLLTDPVTVADAVQAGQVGPLLTLLARAFTNALQGLLAYL